MTVQKGQVLNPKGSGSVGYKLSQKMIRRYKADFSKHGIATIERLREQSPGEYLRLGVTLLPKHIQIDVSHDFSSVLVEASRRLTEQHEAARAAIEGEVQPIAIGPVVDAVELPEPGAIDAIESELLHEESHTD